jgi:hypothetical protein
MEGYLQHNEFHIYTDQKSLVHLNDQRLHIVWQQKVFTKLLGLNYKIKYKKGTDNGAADALSRNPAHVESIMAMSTCQTQWLEPVLESYSADEYTKELVTKVTLDGSTVPNFSWQQVLLRYKGRIWLGADPGLQRQLLSACHDSVGRTLRCTSHIPKAQTALCMERDENCSAGICQILYGLSTG